MRLKAGLREQPQDLGIVAAAVVGGLVVAVSAADAAGIAVAAVVDLPPTRPMQRLAHRDPWRLAQLPLPLRRLGNLLYLYWCTAPGNTDSFRHKVNPPSHICTARTHLRHIDNDGDSFDSMVAIFVDLLTAHLGREGREKPRVDHVVGAIFETPCTIFSHNISFHKLSVDENKTRECRK